MLDTSKIYTSKNCGNFKVIEFIKWNDVTIEFIETGYKTNTRESHVISGQVKDRFMPSVVGVGFMGGTKYKSKGSNGNTTKAYETWRSMLKRCYCHKTQLRQPTYIGCTVCDEWHDFQVFAEWFDLNYILESHLDKDILVKGNKVYGPVSCSFISQSDNNIDSHAKHYLFTSPYNERLEIYNLAKFCRGNKLNHSRMSAVHLGKIKSHKGWVKA